MIKVHFDTPEQEVARAYGVYQYDWGQRIQVKGLESLNLPNHTEVHFAIEDEETAITRVSTVTNGVLVCDVPFKCMQFAKQITADIYVLNNDTDGGQTIKRIYFTPRGKAKPDDDITPDEERTVDAIVKTLNAATAQAQIDVAGAATAAQTATAAKTAATQAAAAAGQSQTAAGKSQTAAAQSAAAAAENADKVQTMYNNLTINIDGGDAVNVDTHTIDGGTAETTP